MLKTYNKFLIIFVISFYLGAVIVAFIFSLKKQPNIEINSILKHQVSVSPYSPSTFTDLTPEEKIGQLFAVPISALNGQDLIDANYLKPGFIGLFDTEDLTRIPLENAIRKIKAEIQLSSNSEPLIFLDFEGGRVNRLRTYWGDAESLEQACQTLTPAQMYEKGKNVGNMFTGAFNLDGIWGPVIDRTNSRSSILNTRTCSKDPQEIIQKVGAYITGVESEGLMTIIKHYPGLGGTHLDPHLILGSVEQIDEEVFLPLLASASGVMVTHIKVGDDQLPCTLSSKCLSPLNRFRTTKNNLLIFSDDLGMDAIENNFSDFEAAYLALIAGVDVLIYGKGFDYQRLEELRNQLVNQYDQDPYLRLRIDESLQRILQIKEARKPNH